MNVRQSFMIIVACTAFVASSCGSDDTADDSSASTEPTVDESPAATTEVGCPPVDGSGEQLQAFDGPPPDCLDPDATYQALVVTNKGEFTIELNADSAPVTTNNFVFLARNQYFDNTVCHRIIPGFVVQCGDPTATGTGGPGYTITDEPPSAGEYQIGSIAMANTGAPDSGGSQFFIITGEQGAALPPQYSLFGEVIEGFDGTVVLMEAAGSAAGNPNEPIEIESITIIQS